MNIVTQSIRQARDFIVAHRAVFIAVFTVMVFSAVSMAQSSSSSSGVNVNLDLSEFWTGFNTFFNALFPPFAFIASIGAAIGFIFMVINALVKAFQSRFGGR